MYYMDPDKYCCPGASVVLIFEMNVTNYDKINRDLSSACQHHPCQFCNAELDALEADMGMESEVGVPSYLQPDKESDLEELNLPSAPTGHAAPAGRTNAQVNLI